MAGRRPLVDSIIRTTLEGHAKAVQSVSWSPDSEHVASGSVDSTIKIWRAKTGSLVRTIEGHTGAVNSVLWSRDGLRVVSGSGDGSVKMWNSETGMLERTLEGHTEDVVAVAWSIDGQFLLSGSFDRSAIIWSAEGALVHTLKGHETWSNGPPEKDGGHTQAVRTVAWSPSGHLVASGSQDTTTKLWNTETGAC